MNTRGVGDRRGQPAGETWPVFLSLAAAMTFDLVSLGASVDPFRPDLAMLVLLFWSTRMHSPANVGSAWCVGLLRDIATLTPLGLNAGVYCLGAWLGMGIRQRLESMQVPGEMLLVLLILLTTSVLSWGIGWLAGAQVDAQSHLVAPMVGTLCWPIVRVTLQGVTSRRRASRADD